VLCLVICVYFFPSSTFQLLDKLIAPQIKDKLSLVRKDNQDWSNLTKIRSKAVPQAEILGELNELN
jgi:hypothetical protein